MSYKKADVEANPDVCKDLFHEGASWILVTSTAARTEIGGQPVMMVAVLINKNNPPPQDINVSEMINSLADNLKDNVARVMSGMEPIWHEMISKRERN